MLSTARKTTVASVKDVEFISYYLCISEKAGYYGQFLVTWLVDDLKWRETMPADFEHYVLEQMKLK